MACEYRFANYSFQDTARGGAAHAGMDAMCAEGWHVHTAILNFTEVSVLWERGAPDGPRSPGRRRARPQEPEPPGQ